MKKSTSAFIVRRLGSIIEKNDEARDALVTAVNELFDPGTENHKKQTNKFREIIRLAQIKSEKLKEERENPVIYTFTKRGNQHEIRKRDVEKFMLRSPNYKNVRLDMLSE